MVVALGLKPTTFHMSDKGDRLYCRMHHEVRWWDKGLRMELKTGWRKAWVFFYDERLSCGRNMG